MRVDKYKPISVVFIYGKQGLYTAVARDNPNDSLINITTGGNLGAPSSSFSLTFVSRRIYAEKNEPWIQRDINRKSWTWDEVLEPNDLVAIKMFRPNHNVMYRPTTASKKQAVTYTDVLSRLMDPFDNFGLVQLGLIDRVAKTKDIRSGQPSESITVTGRDVGGKFSLNIPIYYSPQLGQLQAIPDIRTTIWMAEGMSFMGRPAEIIGSAFLLKFLVSINVNFQNKSESQGKTYFKADDVLKFRLGGNSSHSIPFAMDLVQYQGPFWNYFEMVANRPWNEFWWDTRFDYDDVIPESEVFKKTAVLAGETVERTTEVPEDARVSPFKSINVETVVADQSSPEVKQSKFCCTLFMRQTPFICPFDSSYKESRERWNRLPVAIIENQDIAHIDIGRDDNEVFNWFRATSSGLIIPEQTQKFIGSPMHIFEQSMTTYGIKVLEIGSRVIGDVGDSRDPNSPTYLQRLSQLGELIAGWHYRNQEMANGTLMVKGNQDYRIGDRVQFEYQGERYEAYIERVNQSFTNFGSWTTTLGFTRADLVGFDHKKRFTAEPYKQLFLNEQL